MIRRENGAVSRKRCIEQDGLVALDIIDRHKKDIKKMTRKRQEETLMTRHKKLLKQKKFTGNKSKLCQRGSLRGLAKHKERKRSLASCPKTS